MENPRGTMTTESTNSDLSECNNVLLVTEQLSGSFFDEKTGSSCDIKFQISQKDVCVENYVVEKSKIQNSCKFDSVSGIQRNSGKMKDFCDDNEEKEKQLHPGIQIWDKTINSCAENRLKGTDPNDFLSEDTPSRKVYQPVKKEMVHNFDKYKAELSVSDEDRSEMSESCSRQLRKAASESQNCWSLPDVTDPVSLSTVDKLLQEGDQEVKATLLPTDDKIEIGLCGELKKTLPSFCNSSDSRKMETPFSCRIICDTQSGDKKEENQTVSCVDDPVGSGDLFDVSSDKISHVESHIEHPTLSAYDNIEIPLHTCGKLKLPSDSNCNKEVREKDEHQTVKPFHSFKLPVDENRLQNDYESVKMKLLELKQKFDKAVCNNGTDKLPSSLACVHSDKEIKLMQGDKSTIKTTDPFDLSSEDDLYPEKYRPLKRKLCAESKNSTENKNTNREQGKMDGAADVDSKSVAVSLTTPEIKKPKTVYRVAYLHSQQLLEKSNELIRIKGRAELVHSLIASFGLLQYLQVVSPRCATDTEILGFHCPDYISFLRDLGDVPEGEDNRIGDAESYGLSYDCPLQKGIYETCSLISGATIVAAETLISNAADVVINWYGGWHHAKRDSAAGFCYINDIVLGILKLREKFDRILYVDIDLHHGDGVEEAFCMTPKVMTVSFHKYMCGFFPGTGSVTDVGTGKGKYYSVNVPLLDGIKNAEFCAVFYSVMKLVKEKFQPQVVVLQCGADTLSSDPMTSFNLTHLGISKCVGLMLSWNLPTMLLGGGGYNFPNTAKCWSFLTSLAVGKKLPLDIPEHEHLLAYGPDFEMSTTAGNRKDHNTREHLANLVAKISRNLSSI